MGSVLIEAIRQRRSVRSFDGRPLSEADSKRIMDFAEKVENPYCIPITWRLLDAKKHGLNSPVIVGSDLYIAGKMHRGPHAEEAFGYAFEKIVLYAQTIGIGTTWIAGTMNRDAFEKAMEVSAGEVMPCVSPLGYPAKKMSLREALMRKGVRADSRLDFKDLFFDGSFEKPLEKTEAGKLSAVLDAVCLAPSAVNKQPWRVVISSGKAHFYEKPSRGFVSENGWDIQKIDMGIALCHFEVASSECNLVATFTVDDPGIPVPDGMKYIATIATA